MGFDHDRSHHHECTRGCGFFVWPSRRVNSAACRRDSQECVGHSRYIRDANFTAIHIWDLEFLFKAYDDGFFAGLGQRALEGTRIQFRLAPRLTRAGGKTTRFTKPSGEVSYEIAIASMLFSVPICAPVSSRMTTGMLAGCVATLAIATPVPSTVCQCCRTQGHRTIALS